MNEAAITDLITRLADDALIIAHRNSEWTGLGPMLEEDIAFSSIAQDKLGHAQALYNILHTNFGQPDPDTVAFTRNEAQFRCCHLVELPIGDYAFSLIRHFLHDAAEWVRYEALEQSTVVPLAQLARKIKGEIKYHLFHAKTWVVQLGAQGNEESHARMQSALNETFPLALGMFEPSEFDGELAAAGIYPGEGQVQQRWLELIAPVLEQATLRMPLVEGADLAASYGGRKGYHTVHLQPMLNEMAEVYRIDPAAEW
ncbi:MAG: phenylacetate-CoA oxygenase subunit PaaC [Armatimonadetes bacterium]|nr:phenylacetate-CoA oxygenase subunit PaaC [Armatimonadota bacterium]